MELFFKLFEVCGRISAEAKAAAPDLTACIELLTSLFPSRGVARLQFRSAASAYAGGRTGDQAYRASQDERRGRALAARGSTLVMTAGTEELLQVVVGTRQTFDRIAMKQAWPVAARHLEEPLQRGSQRTRLGSVARHRLEQGAQAVHHLRRIMLLGVVQDMSHTVDPREGGPYVGPEGVRLFQPFAQQGVQLVQGLRKSPFFSAPARLCSIAESRSCSTSPEACSGGRPSSVSEVRTAAQ
jgi:hypothetical protein